jgi:hypothetical protein
MLSYFRPNKGLATDIGHSIIKKVRLEYQKSQVKTQKIIEKVRLIIEKVRLRLTTNSISMSYKLLNQSNILNKYFKYQLKKQRLLKIVVFKSLFAKNTAFRFLELSKVYQLLVLNDNSMNLIIIYYKFTIIVNYTYMLVI